MDGLIFITLFCGLFLTLPVITDATGSLPVIGTVGKKQPRSPSPDNGPTIQESNDVKDINVPVGLPLTLTCTGKREMNWDIPNANAQYDGRANMNRLPVSGGWKSTLTVLNTVAADTGRYKCFYIDSPLTGGIQDDNRDDVSFINIFVNDPNNLYVPSPTSHPGFPSFITLKENIPAVIPCKPTYPGAKVFLLAGNGRPVEKTEDVKFDPSVGFIIQYPNVFFVGDFTCRYEMTLNGIPVKQEERLSLHYTRDTEPPRPVIDSSQARHVVAGGTFLLTCNVTASDDVLVEVKWEFPSASTAKRAMEVMNYHERRSEHLNNVVIKTHQNFLTIRNVDESLDKGVYTCVSELLVSQKQSRTSFTLNVFSAGVESHLEMKPTKTVIRVPRGNTTRLDVEYEAFPPPTFQWQKNGVDVQKGGRFMPGMDGSKISLSIVEVSGNDAGNYTLLAFAGSGSAAVNIELLVLEMASVELESNASKPFFALDGNVNFECIASGFPTPEVTWSFQPCTRSCLDTDMKPESLGGRWDPIDVHKVSARVDLNGRKVHSRYPVTARQLGSGFLRCRATNRFFLRNFVADKVERVIASDVDGGFQVKMVPESPIENQKIIMSCLANNYEFDKPVWEVRFRDNSDYVPVQKGTRFDMTYEKDLYSHKLTLIIPSASNQQIGQYRCVANYFKSPARKNSPPIHLSLVQAEPPRFEAQVQNDPADRTIPYKATLTLDCSAQGAPPPTYVWTRDGIIIGQVPPIRFEKGGAIMINDKITEDEKGLYECEASNSKGKEVKRWSIKVDTSPEQRRRTGFIIGGSIGGVMLVLVPILVCVCLRLRKEQKRREELEYLEAIMNNDTANPALIDPSVPLIEQVQLLPYDDKWEIPRENLILYNKVLGTGQFGRVLKGQALDLFGEKGTKTTVAVKMLKETADLVQRKALLGEIKIMGYIGQHVNVVNLMGAVTKNVGRGEVYMLTEYCRHGSLKDYLQNHQGNRFFNQVDVITGRLLPLSAEQAEAIGKQQQDLNSQAEKNWDGHIVTTRDLICYSFQVSNGMTYLAGKNVIHRDLAARNVLVADDNVVKICDFGLAKQQYTYLRTQQAELPIKWLAIESIYESIFSKESDVWAFGIVLWELFTLGSTPYPGVNVDSDFVERIRNGYRMERPYLAPKEIYEIMRHCWESVPKSRPVFSALSAQLGDLLENSTRTHYLDLNQPYERYNKENPSEYMNDPLKRSSQIDGSNQYLNSYRLTPAVAAPRPVTPIKPKRSLRPTADGQKHSALDSMELQPFLTGKKGSPQNPSRPGNLIENEDYLNDNFIKVPANRSLQRNGLPTGDETDGFHTLDSVDSGVDTRTNYLYAAAAPPKKNALLPVTSDV